MKKRIRIAAAVVLLLALVVAYGTGMLHRAAFTLATAANIEWGHSSPQTIHIYFPRWACGEAHPPYLLVETDDAASASLVGTHIRVPDDDAIEFSDDYFAACRGQFKTTLAMAVWEHRIRQMEGLRDDEHAVTGRLFAVESCEAAVPTLEQTLKIEALMKRYQDPE